MSGLHPLWRVLSLTGLVGLSGGCLDYGLFGKEAPEEEGGRPRAQGSGEAVPDGGDTGPEGDIPPEACNGRDDDGDGDIDEGFPDTDGDGTADCVDEACEVAHVAAGSVPVDDDCLAPDLDVPDPFELVVEWQHRPVPYGPIVMPAIGQLTDDNGDGVVDGDDTPDVAVVLQATGDLLLLDGATGAPHLQLPGFHQWGGVAIADVDSDGQSEVLAVSSDQHVVALDGSGTRKWTSADSFGEIWQYYPQPTVADLDGDGDVEVIFDKVILDGTTGVTEAILGTSSTSEHSIPAVGDLDGDGDLDWVLSSIYGQSPKWHFLENDGRGGFVLALEVEPTQDASCCIMVDLDLDGDLDAALIDEREDEMILLRND